MTPHSRQKVLLVALVGALGATALILGHPDLRDALVPSASASRVRAGLAPPLPVTGEGGLEIRLSDGAARPGDAERAKPATDAVPLSDTEAAGILARLPAVDAKPTDRVDAALPPKSLPPPRAGITRLDPWPPATTGDGPPVTRVEPLTILRHAPEGDLPLAGRVAITFSQPMVAVTSHAQAEGTLPVRMTPQPPGKWRWAGSQLLIFEGPEAFRLPMATRYQLEIPAGTRSLSGGTLAEAHRFEFTTPPPRIERSEPAHGPQPLDPLVMMLFDQRMDAAAVHARLRMIAGSETVATRAIDPRAQNADGAAVRAFAGGDALLDRVVALRAARPLPTATTVVVTVPAGTPSAEGPVPTPADQSLAFTTYGPLRVTEHRCGWQEGDCPPEAPWLVRFSNPLATDALESARVSVTPAVEDLDIESGGDIIWLRGAFAARTTYQVTIPGTVRDVFGQSLGEAATLTFRTGPARPQLFSPSGPFVVLDPAGPPALRVYSAGQRSLRVKLMRVDPARHWSEYHEALQGRWQDRERRFIAPGTTALSKSIELRGDVDALTETLVDLSPALDKGLGHVLVVVEPGTRMKDDPDAMVIAWVEATRLGLSAFVDGESLLAWATDLATGAAAEGVTVEIGPGPTAIGRSGADGLAKLPLPPSQATPVTADGSPRSGGALAPGEEKILRGNRFVLARRGGDVAFLPENPQGWWQGTSWASSSPHFPIAWHVFDDRGLYRPGETARVKGWVRRLPNRRQGDVEILGAGGPVSWRLQDSVGNEVATGSVPMSELGGFDVRLDLPAGMNLGGATLFLSAPGAGTFARTLRVEEFRRPEFEVSVSAGSGPFLVGGDALATASARYYAGGPLPDAEVAWRVTATPGDFRPPGWDEFTFGEWVPWWRSWQPRPSRVLEHAGRTDGSGDHLLHLEFLSCVPPRATSVVAEATVQDVNRQAWSARTTMLVHPSDLWPGLRAKKPFIERGQRFEMDVIVTDRDGAAVTGREVTLRAVRMQGRWTSSGWTEEEKDAVEDRVVSGERAARAALKLDRSGAWTITARVEDELGRPNETVIRAWVAGQETPSANKLEQLEVELIPDAKEYRPGDVARVLVRAPFAPAEALLTLRLEGLAVERRMRLTESSTVVEIPIEESWLPGITAQVDLAGQNDGRPAFASGSVPLAISTRTRALTVTVAPDDAALDPGGSTTLRLSVRDAAGRPVAGEVAVIVADEAVLALTGYELLDPLATFYPLRGPGVADHHLRTHLELARSLPVTDDEQRGNRKEKDGGGAYRQRGAVGGMAMEGAVAPMMAKMAMDAAAPMPASPAESVAPSGDPIALRQDMNPLALFEPAVLVGADGEARVSLKLPDSLTRYRVMAVAVSGPRMFGKGEASVTARKPLMVRPSLPRFLNFGDRAELPVVVQNQGGKPLSVKVALRATNARLAGPSGYRVTVPANDRVEVRFPAVTDMAGTARVQVVAVSGALADAAELSLPVWTPATSEAFATYGVLDAGAVAQPIVPPADVLPQFGELSLTTSSTALFELGDAVLSLWSYRFECSEQIASRMLGVLALRDAVGAFGKLPPKAELDAAIDRDVQMLRRRQSWNGDVGLWRHPDAERHRWPWVSVHASHALLLAKAKGHDVPGGTLDAARRVLREIESRIPSDYPASCRRAIVAHALHVRQVFGDADPKAAAALFAEIPIEDHGLETLGFLLPTLHANAPTRPQAAAIVQHVRNRAAEESGTVSFTQAYGDADWLVMHSSRRADGILLGALLQVDPASDLLPKLVRGLLGARVRGTWSNTQEESFILLAMDRYFAVHERVAPDFRATAWLGSQPMAAQEWRGRSTERRLVEVPMREVIAGGARDVVIAKEGTGRLYYRLGMTYVPASLRLDPSQHGFVVERSYEGVENAGDVRRDADGTWRFKAGALVRSRVTMVATARRTHVALVDPLPAGVEALNPALATTQAVPTATGGLAVAGSVAAESQPWWWWGPWFEHQNLRDDRAEAFSANVAAGAWEYAWVGRATTPGTFVVPPAKAEEMYHPETFGRTATDTVIVE